MNKRYFIIAVAALLYSSFSYDVGYASRAELQKMGAGLSLEEAVAQSPGKEREKEYLRVKQAGVSGLEDEALGNVIYSPEGERKPYRKSIMGLDWGESIKEDACTEIVFGKDNAVYFRDIILRVASLGFGSYVKGELKEDGTISVPVPQMLVEYEGGYGREVTLMEKDSEGEWHVSSLPEITYAYSETTGVIKSALPGDPGQYAIGLKWSFDDDWNEIGDFMQIYTPYAGEFTSVPENVDLEEYYLNDGYYAYPVQVGFGTDAVYIKGLSQASPDAVIKAPFDGHKGYIPQDELLGTVMGYFIWTKMMVTDPVSGWALVPSDETYGLEIDVENKLIKSADPDQILILNCEFNRVFYLDGFMDFSLTVPKSYSGTPRNPFGISFDGEEFREYYGLYGFNFNISNISMEGNVLDTSCLYYSIFIDGDILEFEEIENLSGIMYPGVDGVVTRMPFDFSNGYDIQEKSATERFIGIYPDGLTTIGVQAIYEYEGVTTYSDIVTLNVDTGEFTEEAGVAPLKIEDVVSTVYYDLNGRKVQNPDRGLYVRKQTLSDGTIRISKVAL